MFVVASLVLVAYGITPGLTDFRVSDAGLEVLTDVGTAVAMGFSCWSGSTESRSGTRWLADTSVRRRPAVILLAMSPGALWALAGNAVLLLAVWSVTSSGHPEDLVTYQLLFWSAAQLVPCCALGFSVGRVLPLRAVPPLLTFAMWSLSPWLLPPVGLRGGWELYAGPVRGSSNGTWWSVVLERLLDCLVAAHYLLAASVFLLLCARRWRSAVLLTAALTVSWFVPYGLHSASAWDSSR